MRSARHSVCAWSKVCDPGAQSSLAQRKSVQNAAHNMRLSGTASEEKLYRACLRVCRVLMVRGRSCCGGEDYAHLMPFTMYCRSMSPVGSGRPCSMWRRRRAEIYSVMVECLTEEER